MDKANRRVKQYVLMSFFVIIVGLMFTAGCGNMGDDKTCQETGTDNPGEQRPEDLDTLLSTNNCVSCDLSNWRLKQMDLSHSNLSNANLANTDLFKTNLSYAILENTNLSGTNLTDAFMVYSNLTNANLTNADLTNANLSFSNLTGAKLDGAILDNTKLTGVIGIDGN